MNSAADWYADAEQRERVEKNKMSNADRIRQMTDEELADIFQLSDCENCPFWHNNCGARMCRIGFLEWLKQEVEQNGNC